MAAKKLLRLVSGVITEVLGVVVSAGAGNDGDFPVLDATGRLDTSVMPVGIAADTYTALSSEVLAAGDYVYILPAGTIGKASAASGGNDADGFVLAGVGAGVSATMYFEGRNAVVSGKTVGARQYLSDTVPGGTTETAPVGAGKKVQLVGKAVSATSIDTEIGDYVLLIA